MPFSKLVEKHSLVHAPWVVAAKADLDNANAVADGGVTRDLFQESDRREAVINVNATNELFGAELAEPPTGQAAVLHGLDALCIAAPGVIRRLQERLRVGNKTKTFSKLKDVQK